MAEIIVLGGGCFWCTEAVFSMFPGVIKTTTGYAGGHTTNPSYEEVCRGGTGHAEVLQIEHDPKRMPLEKLLEIFFAMHDPTTKDRQGADCGSQYRSIILYNSEGQKEVAKECIKKAQKNFEKPIVTELRKLSTFYPAEDYHKDYFDKNPLQPYCMLVINPKIRKIKKEFNLE